MPPTAEVQAHVRPLASSVRGGCCGECAVRGSPSGADAPGRAARGRPPRFRPRTALSKPRSGSCPRPRRRSPRVDPHQHASRGGRADRRWIRTRRALQLRRRYIRRHLRDLGLRRGSAVDRVGRQQQLLRQPGTAESVAVLVMDLTDFKAVNDSLGHAVGDDLLKQIGPRLAASLRTADTIARLGGDEFAILLPGTDETGAARVAQKMLAALEQSFPLEGEALDIGASVGVAVAPAHATQAEQLLSRADVAMYAAKGSLAGLAVFSAEHERDGAGRLALMSDLRRAVDEGELVLYYQPQIDLRTRGITSVEALVRWMQPKRGLVGPAEFIPLAERTGLIKRLTRTVLTEAIRQARAWELAGLRVPIAVNLSMRNIHDPQLPQTIAQLLQRWDARPDLLRLEMTETVLAADPERALQTMDSLRAMGVHIALDDFGIGYSSLAYLNRLPLDEIKIDRSFVIGMIDDESSATIVRATVELGHGLGYAVVAEGVENAETRQRLTALGCDAIQGFLIAHPMPADQTAEWIGRATVPAAVGRGQLISAVPPIGR